MQKKSLLVALFCGALCLTGCLKNEESASVTQVRLAKAEQLKSLATLNEATATAALIYANAEKTIKDAEAELIKAQAAMVLAQAETEKVRAQLLAVQVELAKVLVEEEKVKLKMLQADLEARLAALEVEKAAAEAAEQAWSNVLANLVAQAQIDAVNNQKKILEAEENLDNYILTLEGQRADSAKYYAGLYFKALDEVQELQVEELKWKATQVLVNQGAVLTRDAIHDMIKENEDQIAENEALIAELKEHQTMTPEEAQAALKTARTALEEAYTEYQDAQAATKVAKAAKDIQDGKEADFTKKWDNWTVELDAKVPYVKKNKTVKVDGTSVVVANYGVNVETEAGATFVPFFNFETTKKVNTWYPGGTVYTKDHDGYVKVQNTVIAPAAIQYDNIQAALDDAIADKETVAAKKIARRTARNEKIAAGLQEEIDAIKEKQELHKDYIAVREEAVTAAEQDYLDALDDAEKAKTEEVEAWVEFQEYMLLTYPTLTSNLFIDRLNAQKAYDAAKADEAEYKNKVQAVKDRNVEGLKAAVKPLFEDYAAAIGAYKEIKDAIEHNKTIEEAWQEGNFWDFWAIFYGVEVPGEAKAAYNAWIESMDVWSPEFADSKLEPVLVEPGVWVKGEGDDAVYAGTSQAAVLDAMFLYDRAEELAYAAYIDYLSGVIDQTAYEAAQQEVVNAQTAIDNAEADQDQAWLDYVAAYNKISEILGVFVNEIEKDYNPDFEVFNYVVFPTDALYDPEGTVDYAVRDGVLDAKGNWEFDATDWAGEVPGLAQRALLNAVKAVVDYYEDLAEAEDALKPYTDAAKEAKDELTAANNALIKALGGDPKTAQIEDYLDEQAETLYKAYLAAKEVEVDVEGAYEALWEAYRAYPDHIGAPTDHNHPYDEPQNFGWLISNYQVDYTATYIGRDGKEHSIAKLLYGKKHPYVHSMQYQIDENEEMIEEVLPAQLAAYEAKQNEAVKTFKSEVSSLLKKINAYKSSENEYDSWVADRNAADKAWNQAKMDEFDAQIVYLLAQALYDGVKAVAEEGIWVYDPDEEINIVNATRQDDFVWVPVADAIKHFEAENADLEAENEYYRNVLTDGEKALATVNQILDEKIETISNNIKILAAVAQQYKAIMNAYLGIDETAATEE